MVYREGKLLLKGAVRSLSRVWTLPRMGSFNSTPKIINEDCQDSDLSLPNSIERQDLLKLCQINSYNLPIIRRKFRWLENAENYGPNHENNPNYIRILQWNILSQALGVMNDNFVKCPEDALDWNFRKYKIIEGIVEYSPDVVCLQEVDHFNFLKAVLGSQGYTGVFFPKPDSPCFYIPDNNGPDGCAIFFKNKKFEMITFHSRILEIWGMQSNQVAICITLKNKTTDKELCIATTHLKARNGTLLSTLRNEQGKDLLKFLGENCHSLPLLLCGDFNGEPIEPIYKTITCQNNNVTTLGNNLSSAYADSSMGEPPYTTWKIRDEGEISHTIDYVFYTPDYLNLLGVLEMPTGEDIGVDRVPNFQYPSDHFSLVSDFFLND